MNPKQVTRPLYLSFVWSFSVSVACFVGLIILGAVAQHEGVSPVEVLLVVLMIIAGPVWYVSLGMLAHRLGRRWLVWVGLSFITSPIGPLVIFPLMLGHVKAARKAISSPAASA
jgi:predicted branched-subunit amino acid permease